VVDFAYVHTWAGFVYVAFVMDALEQAIHARRPGPEDGLIHHSARGTQYLAINYTQRPTEANLVPSVGISATAMTMLWPRRSMASARPK
jgi:putative transposase